MPNCYILPFCCFFLCLYAAIAQPARIPAAPTQAALSSTVQPAAGGNGKVIRIMPLGDSNTFGKRANDTRPDSEITAYRYALHQLLAQTSTRFDFVGSEAAGSTFFADVENAGIPGARTRDWVSILEKGYFYWYDQPNDKRQYPYPYWDTYKPDVILLHIGTNWVEAGTASVRQLLDQIDQYEARASWEVTVLVATSIQRVPFRTQAMTMPGNAG